MPGPASLFPTSLFVIPQSDKSGQQGGLLRKRKAKHRDKTGKGKKKQRKIRHVWEIAIPVVSCRGLSTYVFLEEEYNIPKLPSRCKEA
jgi:hypothetical protein